MTTWQEVLLFVVFGFIVSWVGSFLINLIRVPVIFHSEQYTTISALRDDNNQLLIQIAELKKPKRTAFEDRIHADIRSAFEKYDDDHKSVLRHLILMGKMVESNSFSLRPLPKGIGNDLARAILSKLEADQMVSPKHTQNMGGHECTWEVAPGALPVLKELL